MIDKNCFVRYYSGEYRYKNGVRITHKVDGWYVYVVQGKLLASYRTLRECKFWVVAEYD